MWLLILATPFHGRVFPCHFVSYSSKTINAEAASRNRHHFKAFAEIKELQGEKPLELDREFSYLGLMGNLVFEKGNLVICLQEGAKFTDRESNLVPMSVKNGETRTIVGDDQPENPSSSGHPHVTHEDRR